MPELRTFYRSPIGTIEIIGGESGIRALRFGRRRPGGGGPIHPRLREAIAQLDEYFRGRRKEFTLELHLLGTEFQKQVWRELLKIPYGRTVSYGVLAAALGRPGSARAVGGANHRNPVSIVIPCHRVIGADGRLVGYGGGLWRTEWLLAHEQSAFPRT